MTERNKVGPADPETRRKLLRETLDAEAAEGAARRSAPKPKPKKKRTAAEEVSDALNPRVRRESAHNGETVMDVVDKAVKGAKPDPY
jgi:hypothetical protein